MAIHRLELAEIISDKEPDNTELRRQLDIAREEVEEFNRKASEGAQCRARVKWQVDGEKPSKYFCGLEKYNGLQKYIPQLKIKDDSGKDEIISDQKDIDNEIYKFYFC